MKKENSSEGNFPQDSIQRSYLRNFYVWYGIIRILKNNELNRLHEALKSVGLADGFGIFVPRLLEPNPSDDTLRRLRIFFQLEKMPNLRGRKSENIVDYYFIMDSYFRVLHVLRKLPKSKHGSSDYTFRILKDKGLQEIFSKIPFPETDRESARLLGDYNRKMDDEFLRSLRRYRNGPVLPLKELAVRIIAHIYRKEPEAIRKNLAKARHEISPSVINSLDIPE